MGIDGGEDLGSPEFIPPSIPPACRLVAAAQKRVARMKRSATRDLPAPQTKTRIALRCIRATLDKIISPHDVHLCLNNDYLFL